MTDMHFRSSGYISILLVALIFVAFILATGFTSNSNSQSTDTKYFPSSPTPGFINHALQLNTLPFVTDASSFIPTVPTEPPITPSPISGSYCPRDQYPKSNTCQCLPAEKLGLACQVSWNPQCDASKRDPKGYLINACCQKNYSLNPNFASAWFSGGPSTGLCWYFADNPGYTQYQSNPNCSFGCW